MRFITPVVIFALFISTLSAQTESDTRILEMADRIETRVAKIRDHEFKKSVGKGIYDKEQLGEFILESFEEELPDEKAESWEASLKIFGLIPQKMDLKKTFVDFLVSQVGGFYDPEEKTLKCISSNLTFLLHIVMAHELLHALQDQYLDLNGYYKGVDFNDDLLGARQAVIEGEAQHMTTLYAQRYPQEIAGDMADMDPKDIGIFMIQQVAASQGAPPYFMETMTFPYIKGEQFIRKALDEGGWLMVDALYRRPPASTEQILHPEKFFGDRDDPVKVVLPDMAPVLGSGYEKIYENTMGEMQLGVLVKLTVDPIRAMRAAKGWDGDTYAVYRHAPTGRSLMIWAVVFDSEQDAQEFFEAEKKGFKNKYAAREGSFDVAQIHRAASELSFDPESIVHYAGRDGSIGVLHVHGKDVLVLDNFPGDFTLLDEAREAAWGFLRQEFELEELNPEPFQYRPPETKKRRPW